MADRLLTVKAAADMLSMQPSTLYDWARERRIASVKIGRALRFRLSDLEKLIKKGMIPAR